MGSAIDEQIRSVDKVVKECDIARKQLDFLVRRLDDLYDEVKHYREFLTYEKSRRDPILSSKKSKEPVSNGSEVVCSTMKLLTSQLVDEWEGKLKTISKSLTASAVPSGTYNSPSPCQSPTKSS